MTTTATKPTTSTLPIGAVCILQAATDYATPLIGTKVIVSSHTDPTLARDGHDTRITGWTPDGNQEIWAPARTSDLTDTGARVIKCDDEDCPEDCYRATEADGFTAHHHAADAANIAA